MPFSQAPWYTLPVHLCRFRVRSKQWGYFLGHLGRTNNPISSHDGQHPSHPTRFRNINLIPIDYGFRPRLRGRLTLRGITLRRNPWIFGDSVSRTINRYSCQNSHFRYLHQTSQSNFNGLRNAPLPHSKRVSTVSVYGLSPVTSSVRKDLFRPVSCYAFFKGMAASKPTSWLYWTFYSLSHLTITWGP